MYSIQVFLSSYNGEKYIREQIDSILNQRDVKVSLLVRDDGSSDSTLDILAFYEKLDNVKVIRGSNIGVVASFFELFNNTDKSYDFFAFADQDDYWYDDKLLIACNKITKNVKSYLTTPVLYCCEPLDTNENLKPIPIKDVKKSKNTTPSFSNALIENIAKGGGIVFNRALLDIIATPMPENVYMHDWWAYLTASCFGRVIYDENTHYMYRQHTGNVLGAAPSGLSLIKRRLNQCKTNKGHVSKQAIAFAKTFNDIEKSEKKQVSLDILTGYRHSFKQRIRGLSGKYLKRQSKLDDLIFRLLFFTNHL